MTKDNSIYVNNIIYWVYREQGGAIEFSPPLLHSSGGGENPIAPPCTVLLSSAEILMRIY